MRATAAMLTAGFALALTACAGADGPAADSPSPPVQRAEGTILLAAPEAPTATMEAMIVGELTRSESGCLAIDTDEAVYTLQFPYGSVLHADGSTVSVPGLGDVRLGDTIDGGGGYIEVPGVPDECGVGEVFAVWQTVNR